MLIRTPPPDPTLKYEKRLRQLRDFDVCIAILALLSIILAVIQVSCFLT